MAAAQYKLQFQANFKLLTGQKTNISIVADRQKLLNKNQFPTGFPRRILMASVQMQNVSSLDATKLTGSRLMFSLGTKLNAKFGFSYNKQHNTNQIKRIVYRLLPMLTTKCY